MERLLIIDNTTPKYTLHSYNGKVSTLMYSIGNKTRLEQLVEEYSEHYKDIVIISEYAEQLNELAEFKSISDKVNIWNKSNIDLYGYDVKYLVPQNDNEFESKMENFHSNNVSRYFNSIEVKDDVVYKKAITDKGIKLQEIEGEYYNRFNDVSCLCPMLGWDMNNHVLHLKKLNAKTCTEYITEHPSKAVHIYNKFIEAVSELHHLDIDIQDDEQDCEEALYNELIDMVDVRVKPCKKLIESIGTIDTFNDMPVTDHKSLMTMLNRWFDYYKENAKFCLVHGDPNTDNCMYDEDKDKVYFIDPRGYFGTLKTLGYGLLDYDFAKFLYGMTGYSQFNNAPYISVRHEGTNIDVWVGDNVKGMDKVKGISTLNIDMLTENNDIKILVGIIWMKLTSYIINDPIKSVAAYYHGNALLTKYLNEFYKTHTFIK
jgi:hypothetical protein